MNIREAVYQRVKSVAEQQHKSPPPLSGNLRLLEDGLGSLAVAILVVNLDDELNRNPYPSPITEASAFSRMRAAFLPLPINDAGH